MLDAAYNFAKTTISPFDSGATSATLTDPTRFLDPSTKQYNCVVWCSSLYPNPIDDPNKEIVRFTAKSGSVYTFTRAQEGTEAKDHNIEDEIYSVAIVLTEKMISDIQDELDDKAPTESPEFTGTVTLENNEWLRSKDYSEAGYINILKVNEDNEIDVASQMNIGTIEAEEDAGAITLFDMPVSSASADGTEMSATIKIDGNNILKIYAEANGTGGADSFAVKLLSSAALDITETPATSDTDKFLVSDSNRIKYRTGAEVLSDIGGQASLGFTPENITNKKTSLVDNSDTYYPTQKAVKTAVDTKLAITSKASSSEINTGTEDGKYVTPKGLADQTVLEKTSNKKTIITDSNTDYPTGRAVKTYADGLVVGALNYRSAYDASGGTYPTTGGTGSGGAVMKGNMWIISVAGTLGGESVQVGDSIIANIDTPGQTASNWNHLNANVSYVPENIANKKTSLTDSDVDYPTCKAVNTGLSGKQNTLGFTPENVVNKKTTITDSDIDYPTGKAVKTAVDAKQDALGFTPENVANKKTTLADNSDIYYPTQKAVKTAVDAKEPILTKGNLSGSGVITIDNTRQVIGGTAIISHTDSATVRHVTDTEKATWNAKQSALGFTPENVANKKTTITDSDIDYPTCKAVNTGLSGKQNTLGFTPENVANKKTSLADNSDTYYPSQKAVKTAVDAKQDALGYIAENAANKKTSLTDNSDTYYPTQKAVKTAVDGKVNIDQTTPQTITDGSPLFSEGVDMANDKWLKSKDYAGTGDLNILKGNEYDEVDVGTQLNVGSIEAEEDAGAITLFDMPVSSASADGTEMSATIKIDGNNILKIYAESNGAGGVDTFKVQLLNKAVLTMQDSAGTTHTYTADTDGSLNIT